MQGEPIRLTNNEIELRMKNLFNIVVALTTLGMVFIVSCKEDITPTIGEVVVVDENGDRIPFADIMLTCTSSVNKPCEIEIIGKADKNGLFSQEFDLPKVLEITAGGNLYDTIIVGTLPDTKMTFLKDTICGSSFISIKPEETSRQTIILYDCI